MECPWSWLDIVSSGWLWYERECTFWVLLLGPHTANWTCDLLHCCGWKVMDHLRYSHDITSSDLQLFGPLKKHSAGKRYAADTDVMQAVTTWLQTLDTDCFYAEMQALVPEWDKCLSFIGDYVEVWCVPSATHVLCILWCQNKVLANRVFVTLFFLSSFVYWDIW
jgi:hypothetical protein